MNETYYYPALETSLAYYYKMNTREIGTSTYLIDAIAGNDASINDVAKATLGTDADLTFSSKASTDFTMATTASINKPVTMTSKCAPGTVEWAWTFTGADVATSSSPTPVVVFKESGEQTVKLVTKNVNGESSEKERKITIKDVAAPQASFYVSSSEIAAGDHVSFINSSTPLDDCTYEWTLTGADKETAKTINAAATYPVTGTYTVKLTATNAAGSDTFEKQIEVVKVAPQAAFTIHNNVAIVGEEIELVDQTKYEPDTWAWTVASTQNTYLVRGQNTTMKIDEPGVYNVTLNTSNEKGSNTATRARAIYVCAADGETGLKFDDTDDELVATAPFGDSKVSAFSIDFWLYPGALTESCIGIGDSEETFFAHANLDGSMTVTVNNKSVTSISGLIKTNEWHHYAITYSNGTVNFYLDGTPYANSQKINGVSSTPAWSCLRLGGTKAPMNAIIDELRVWKRALTASQMKNYANGPISEPEANTDVVLYYNFNQSTGDVVDHSASNNSGKRTNFGPDGDAWTSSKGIFYLNFEEDKDVTKQYLKNYKAPFKTASGFVNGTTRFKRLQTGTEASPWIQENSVVANGVTTEFHVDANKGNYLTLSTTWDGFAAEVQNLKLYQPVELPAGSYTLYALPGEWEWYPSATKTVVSTGPSLPNWSDTDKALAASYCGIGCKFTLAEPTTVNIGFVSNQSSQKCNAIKEIVLMSSGFHIIDANGGSETALKELRPEVSASNRLQAIGGLGSLSIAVTEPQYVRVFDTAGRLVWSAFVEKDASVSLPAGIYVTAGQKAIVR